VDKFGVTRTRSGSLGLSRPWLWLCQGVVRLITMAKRAWTTLLEKAWTTMKPLPTPFPQGCPRPSMVTNHTVLYTTWQAGPFKGSLFFERTKSARPAAEGGAGCCGGVASPRGGRRP
jgi:hypothetical protein